jgi:hypothetical protein
MRTPAARTASRSSAAGVEVERGGQVVDVVGEEVVRAGGVGGAGPRVRDPGHLLEPGGEDRVRAVLDPPGHLGVGGPAVGRVVLEPAVVGRGVRRGDHDAVGEP